MNLEGSFCALVTPFANGSVDLDKVRELVDFQLENGTRGICPVATTGESPSLTMDERAAVIKTVVERAKGRALVFPGCGTNSTAGTIAQSKAARELGVDGTLLVTPYYNKPSQEGLFRHYEAVTKAVDLPVIVYNVPGRTGVNMLPETTARLSKLPRIIGLKDAANSIDHTTRVRALCDIQILSGDDMLTYPMFCVGGSGVISVAANIIPKTVSEMCAAYLGGDAKKAKEIHVRYNKLFHTLFIDSNPVPVKTALKLMGKLNGEVRLPLWEMAPANIETLKQSLQAYSII